MGNYLCIGSRSRSSTGTAGGTAETVITLVTAAAEQGDFVEMFTDGTWWYINGQCELAANITVA